MSNRDRPEDRGNDPEDRDLGDTGGRDVPEDRDRGDRTPDIGDDHERHTELSESNENNPEGNENLSQDDGDDSNGGLTGTAAIAVSTVVALGVTALAYWWVGGWAGNEVFFEELFRVAPTVQGGGVGTDWVVGNTVPWLDAAIAITHAADVLMGVAILAMVFIHWSIFRQLADRMGRPVDTETTGTVATDGGDRTEEQGGEAR